MRRIKDWTILTGASVEIQQQGNYICAGSVDAVTDDGKILWVTAPSQNRRLFEKAEFYEAWAIEDRDGFHYEFRSASYCHPRPPTPLDQIANGRAPRKVGSATVPQTIARSNKPSPTELRRANCSLRFNNVELARCAGNTKSLFLGQSQDVNVRFGCTPT